MWTLKVDFETDGQLTDEDAQSLLSDVLAQVVDFAGVPCSVVSFGVIES